MITVHLMIPPTLLDKLAMWKPEHRDGHTGYFVQMYKSHLRYWIGHFLDCGYRVDVTPGETYRMIARKVDE